MKCKEFINYIGAGHSKGLKTIPEWWDYMLEFEPETYNHSNVMVGIEQAQNRSYKHKYCAECASDKYLVEQEGKWIYGKYYLCQNCINYYNKKG